MLLAEILKDKSATERAALKAAYVYDTAQVAISTADKAKGEYTFALRDKRKVVIEQARLGVALRDPTGILVFKPRTDGGANPVWFRVSVDGRYLNGDGWYGFVNPPVMVPDGTTEKVEAPDGTMYEYPRFKEDPGAALQIALADVLENQ